MTAAEHGLLVMALGWILGSVPLALLAWQVWWRKGGVEHAVIPHEDAQPAGSFLDVSLPPPLPEASGGVGVRHWRALDGWVALGLLGVLSALMGPLTVPVGEVEAMKLSAKGMGLQFAFQLGLGGLLLFYVGKLRRLDVGRIFGLRQQRLWMVPVWALGWIVPGMVAVAALSWLTMPFLLRMIGQDEASPQLIVRALLETPDALTRGMVVLSVGLGAPFMEELVFRGFLYAVGKRFTHWSYAAGASALFFAVVHGNAMSFLPLCFLGLLFTAAYEHSRSLLVPMAMHSFFNMVQLLVLFYAPQIAPSL